MPGRYATVRWQIWQRVTGRWVTVTGKRREGDLLICLYDARPAGVILHDAHAARTPRGMRVNRDPTRAFWLDGLAEGLTLICVEKAQP